MTNVNTPNDLRVAMRETTRETDIDRDKEDKKDKGEEEEEATHHMSTPQPYDAPLNTSGAMYGVVPTNDINYTQSTSTPSLSAPASLLHYLG